MFLAQTLICIVNEYDCKEDCIPNLAKVLLPSSTIVMIGYVIFSFGKEVKIHPSPEVRLIALGSVSLDFKKSLINNTVSDRHVAEFIVIVNSLVLLPSKHRR
jgi:hypothetical protein